jgi:hypothetical protein
MHPLLPPLCWLAGSADAPAAAQPAKQMCKVMFKGSQPLQITQAEQDNMTAALQTQGS